ncbi:hypothetical protein MKW94_017596 [Papaver nudicaule]|uniref:RNA polymerase Rpb4/RPC9 core domain-containing protein n=1 Tax=Papaver nudicaule TaxID=74823 RepID=A0AA41SH31_PAPNU|nr:hypothetical protein [Papaver nudicaule]
MSEQEEQNVVELKTGEVIFSLHAFGFCNIMTVCPFRILKAKCLMNCEVALILVRKYDHLQAMSSDPVSQVSQVFEKSQQYIKRISRYKNDDDVRQVREILSRYQLVEFELWVLGNLCPETANEAKSIVLSITTKERGCTDENIEKMLGDLSLIKKIE